MANADGTYSIEDLYDQLKNADANGDKEGVQKLGTHIQYLLDPNGGNYYGAGSGHTAPGTMPNRATDTPAMNPTEGDGSTYQPFGFDTGIRKGAGTLQFGPFDSGIQTPQFVDRSLSGMGQAVSNLGSGFMQRVASLKDGVLPGSPTAPNLQAQTAEQRQLDAPLNATTAGTLGNIGMNVGMMLPSLAIPGSSSLAGSAALGSIYGNMQPTTSDNETALNTGLGAVGGPLGIGAGRLVGSMVNGVVNTVKPFLSAGRDNMIGSLLIRSAGGPQRAQLAIDAMDAAPQFPGTQNTVGMTAGNSGLATLQRAASRSPDLGELYDARNRTNANAILDAVRGLGGDDTALASAKSARDAAARPLYDAAKSQTVTADPALDAILSTPAAKSAWARAQTLAENNQETISTGPISVSASPIVNASGSSIATSSGAPATYSVNGLHYLKMALDDAIAKTGEGGITGNELRAYQGIQGKLVSWLNQKVPEYGQASAAYAKASQPVNAIETGNALHAILSPAFNDVKTAKVVNGSPFSKALANGDQVAQKATGFPGATLDNSFTPQQLDTLQNANRALGQMSDSMTLGKPPGSDTAKNLVADNILQGIGAPFKAGLENNALARTIFGPTNFITKYATEPMVQNRLATSLLNPQDAVALMRKAMPNANAQQIQNAVDQFSRMSTQSLLDSAEQRSFKPARRN